MVGTTLTSYQPRLCRRDLSQRGRQSVPSVTDSSNDLTHTLESARHDAVLQEIVDAVVPHLPSTAQWTADIGCTYNFPLHIVPTDLRPDLVWWDDIRKSLCLAELTVCYDTNFEEAAVRKQAKYEDLARQARGNGYRTTILTIQVGSRGVPDRQSFSQLATILGILEKDLTKLLEWVVRAALVGSFTIWCSRNRRTTES